MFGDFLVGIGNVEVVQRLVAQVVEHRPALAVVELGKGLVGALGFVVVARDIHRDRGVLFVAVVRPDDAGIQVVTPRAFDQHFAENPADRVVVADLRQRHVHRRVLAAGFHEFGTDLLGDQRRLRRDLGHRDRAGFFFAPAGDHVHRFGHRRRDLQFQVAHIADLRRSVQRHVTTGEQGDRAQGIEHRQAGDGDLATEQVGPRDGAFKPRPAPADVDARMQFDAAGGGAEETVAGDTDFAFG